VRQADECTGRAAKAVREREELRSYEYYAVDEALDEETEQLRAEKASLQAALTAAKGEIERLGRIARPRMNEL
jgi:predicted nuclease with TOPRIM domain